MHASTASSSFEANTLPHHLWKHERNNDTHNMQNKIQAVIKMKLWYPRHMKNDVLYAHEQAGGIGIDLMEDLVNVHRLVLVIVCLDQGGEMEVIVRGAVERRKYTGVNGYPMVEHITSKCHHRQTRQVVVHTESMDGKTECDTRHQLRRERSHA